MLPTLTAKRHGEEDYDKYDTRKHRKLRPTSMARIMGLSLNELQLLRFYNEKSHPMLKLATGVNDQVWMGSVPGLASSSRALTKACMVFADMHLSHERNPYRYILQGNRPLLKTKGRPDNMKEVIGYSTLPEIVQERLLINFTEALTLLKAEIMELDTSAPDTTVMLTAVIVYLSAVSLHAYIPLVNFEKGGGDLFGVIRLIADMRALFLGNDAIRQSPYPVPLVGRRYLPHENELWAITKLVKGMGAKERYVRNALTREIYSLIELYNLDQTNNCGAHLPAWSIYWHPSFSELKNDLNPYALLLICFFCGYLHQYHALFWWGSRLQDDLHQIVDHLPEELLRYVQWPLSEVKNYEHNHMDWLKKGQH